MAIVMHGKWRLEVTKAVHSWENRWRVEGAATGDGTYPPDVGTVVHADGLPSWRLIAEHENPANPGLWAASEMSTLAETVTGAELEYLIGAEDPLPQRDFEDIQWHARFEGSMIDIPYRPFAVRPSDLFQMPDGIFESSLGTYYMGVRVTNTWGRPLTDTHVLNVTPSSRVDLAAAGVHVIDLWSGEELESLGQRQHGTGIVIGPLPPGESTTVYLKINVAVASPRKHHIDFVCLDMAGTPDPDNPKRRITKPIWVSSSHVDHATGDLVATVAQGTMRVKLKEVAFDPTTAKKGRRRFTTTRPPSGVTSNDLAEMLKQLLGGATIDPCELVDRIFDLFCECREPAGGAGDGAGKPRDGRFEYDPFYAIPTKFEITVVPSVPYDGKFGPLPFDDPWWKVLLLILAVVLLIAAMVSEGSDVAYHDEDLVIGQLTRFQQDDIDAAVTRLDGSRALPASLMTLLDAQTGELNESPVIALDGTVVAVGPPLTSGEVTALLTLPINDPARRVFKSGARTGVTHGRISGFSPTGTRDDGTVFSTNQVLVAQDPAFGMEVSNKGDSGSIWVQTATMRPLALHHSGDTAGTLAVGSLLADVATALNVTFN